MRGLQFIIIRQLLLKTEVIEHAYIRALDSIEIGKLRVDLISLLYIID